MSTPVTLTLLQSVLKASFGYEGIREGCLYKLHAIPSCICNQSGYSSNSIFNIKHNRFDLVVMVLLMLILFSS